MVILFLGGVIWIGSHDLDPFKPISSADKPTEVQVVSLDWQWLFIYPGQGGASLHALALPAGTPVHFSLSSPSVRNMLLLPQPAPPIAPLHRIPPPLPPP